MGWEQHRIQIMTEFSFWGEHIISIKYFNENVFYAAPILFRQ